MLPYIALGFIQGFVHEMLRRMVSLHGRLFWWDVRGRIGTYFIYVLIAALLFLGPLYALMRIQPDLVWSEVAWYWLGGLVLGIFLSRVFAKKRLSRLR